jgi:hypothetical protein
MRFDMRTRFDTRPMFARRSPHASRGLVALALLAAACSVEHPALPTAATTTAGDRAQWNRIRPVCPGVPVPEQIVKLFPRDADSPDGESFPLLDRNHLRAWRAIADFEFAVALYNHGDVATAQAIVARLYNFIQQEFNDGKLVGAGAPAGAQAVATLGQAMFCEVGITANFSSNLNDNVVAIVPPNTDTIVRTGTANSGLQIFASQQLPQTVVVITRLPDTAHTVTCPQYSGPLCTPLAQFPPFYDYVLNPAPSLGQSAPPFNVEECVDTTQVHVPIAQLFIAHNVGDTAQVLPKETGNLGLACDGMTGMAPKHSVFELARRGDVSGATLELASRVEDLFVTDAYALFSTGVTGQTRSFSPFGIVDVNDFVAYRNGHWTYHAPTITLVPPAPSTGDIAGFQAPGFVLDPTWVRNASAFGNAPFGSGSAGFGCPLSALTYLNTVWPSFPTPPSTGNLNLDASTIFLLRTNFFVPANWAQDLHVGVAIDNDIEVFVNGTPVTPTSSGSPVFVVHEGCAAQDSYIFDVPLSLLVPGQQNLLAIRARDRGGESYVDARLSPTTPLTPP